MGINVYIGSATIPGGEPEGFPDSTNTGYLNAPGYPGSFAKTIVWDPSQSRFEDEATGAEFVLVNGTTYSYYSFPGGFAIGNVSTHPANITFYGCRFAANTVDDANVANYGDGITFEYCTFEPSADAAPPTPYDDGYQYGIDVRFNGAMTVDHCDLWGWGNGIQFGSSTQAKPLIVRDSWFHDARADGGGIDHTDAILCNNGGPSYMVFDHNTIASVGNTQGLALQTEASDDPYHHVEITGNYFSGFGYTVAIGEDRTGDHDITFTDNTYGTDFEPVFGELYDADSWDSATNGNLWRRNRWKVVPSAWNYTPETDDGKFWWPDGTKRDTDYAG